MSMSRKKYAKAYSKTDGVCWYCGKPAQEIDHVAPVLSGRDDTIENLVPICRSCNRSKRGNQLEDWRNKVGAKRGMSFTEEQREYWASRGIDLPTDEAYKFYFERE